MSKTAMGLPIAHVRDSDDAEQLLSDHLEGTARRCAQSAGKIGLGPAGELIGLFHDLGKHSDAFQNYLRSRTGKEDPDADDDLPAAQRGKVDHSTAGAKFVWNALSKAGPLGPIVGQALALCIASHHSGLIDCLVADPVEGPRDDFSRRMLKGEARTHLDEALGKLDPKIRARAAALLQDESLVTSFTKHLHDIALGSPDRSDRNQVAQFQLGLLVRMLFSCLIDADREDTADFERRHAAQERQHGEFTSWDVLANRLEDHLTKLEPQHPIDAVRRDISEHCRQAASRPRGIFTLTVPTGGGKTLASLRFALHHARAHGLHRVIYVVPFTTIIDQNADVARRILEPASCPEDHGKVVLEHHSNLGPPQQGWKNKLLSENWDAPVVYTTSVQFLEAILGGGTRGVRRMHQLARALIVFDEIQGLPVKCIHLFNNAINLLAAQGGSTVVLCTATQPLLGQVDAKKGAAKIASGSEIVPDVQNTFSRLRRVEVKDARRPGGWHDGDIADLARAEVARSGSCLVVVNTRKAAKALFKTASGHGLPVHHLSTCMCPAHRKSSLTQIRQQLLDHEPILCISTQLIEAGVDLDFGCVIRFAAGLDSIAQAAGRCNRSGRNPTGIVHVVNPTEESLSSIRDIDIAREKAARVLDDFRDDPERFDNDLLSPKAMAWFYENYFFARKDEMGYPINPGKAGRGDDLLDMLSTNSLITGFRQGKVNYFRQSFKTANDTFQAIDAPTKGVVVPYGEGRRLIGELCAATDVDKEFRLLRAAQQFTVNIFSHEFDRLRDAQAIFEVQPGTEIFHLNESYYSRDFGLSTEPVSPGEFLYVEQIQKHA